MVTLPKKFWTRVLDLVVIQLYAGEYKPSVDRALSLWHLVFYFQI